MSKGTNSKNKSFLATAWRRLKKIMLWFVIITIFFVLLYRFVNPPITPLMVIRAFQQKADGKNMRIIKEWVPIEDIAPNMVFAMMAAEDQKFLDHYGFDFDAITNAFKRNMKGKKLRGGSTISQQTAKNIFLWPGRDWIRKGFEVYYTGMLELLWSKERIMEVYLNIIEFGDGIYGIEAAAQHYYHKPASKLTKYEAISLAAVVPAPRKRNPLDPSAKVSRHMHHIKKNMRFVKKHAKGNADWLAE